ncbi:hypothetical protein [Capnocytophaga canimorsus]|uniref:hypothetical protein n=1 Tax=Capnocytophaga canimorsus TaxID=28188 RepID=UPI001561F51D|nr:hypothetical protein [Capnocytophaga canimorsus]
MKKSHFKLYKNHTLYGIIVLLFVFYHNENGYAQQLIEIKPASEKYDDLEFPIISCEDKYVESKINILLQLSEIEILIDKKESNIFQRIELDSTANGKSFMKYQVLSNFERNVALRFDQIANSYTSHYWNQYYNFNPRNGDLYHLKDFFNTAEFQAFKTFVSKQRIADLAPQITDEYQKYILQYIEEDNLMDFYFNESDLFFDAYNLIHKNDKAFGFSTITKISISEIAHWLNDFGKAVLIGGKDIKQYCSSNDLQLYEGTIAGKYPFYMVFNSYRGIYAYKKYRKGIHLLPKEQSKDTFSFAEYDRKDDNAKDNTLIFKRNNNTLTGFWISETGTKKTFWAKRK